MGVKFINSLTDNMNIRHKATAWKAMYIFIFIFTMVNVNFQLIYQITQLFIFNKSENFNGCSSGFHQFMTYLSYIYHSEFFVLFGTMIMISRFFAALCHHNETQGSEYEYADAVIS